jgi:hypothetical protein
MILSLYFYILKEFFLLLGNRNLPEKMYFLKGDKGFPSFPPLGGLLYTGEEEVRRGLIRWPVERILPQFFS